MSKKQQPITWSSKRVKANVLDPTPNNYKIKTDIGRERFLTSLGKFGRAGAVVVNPSTKKGRYDIIDGNSRVEEQMAKNPNAVMEVSVPSRRLTPAEYKEMSAMFDFAKAGDVDIERIQKDLGTSKDFFAKWGMEMPHELAEKLDKMGSKADVKELEYPEEGEGKGAKKNGKGSEPQPSDIRMVQAYFTSDQEEEFRKMETELEKVLEVDNTTDIIFKSIKFTYESKCAKSKPKQSTKNGKAAKSKKGKR